MRRSMVEQLYHYLEFELSPQGLFEYAFFVIELWSMRASRHAAEWLESTPIFTDVRFDEILDRARKVGDLKRPQAFGPILPDRWQEGQGAIPRAHTSRLGAGLLPGVDGIWGRVCRSGSG